jgi:copper chaperone NosL
MDEEGRMKSLLQWRWLLLITLVVLAACNSGPATPEPAKIRFGETICAECGMIISQPKYASSFAYEESEGRFKSLPFDDIGDMLGHMQAHSDLLPVGVWVHDYDSEEWIEAETAYFVHSSAIKSPMGHGIAAFADKAAAERLATETAGEILDWDRLRTEVATMEHQH